MPSSSDMELPPYDPSTSSSTDIDDYNKYSSEFPPLYEANQPILHRNPEMIPMLGSTLYDPPPRYDDSDNYSQNVSDHQPILAPNADLQNDFMASTMYINSPVDMLCPYCRKMVCTEIRYTPGVATYLTAATCCLLG